MNINGEGSLRDGYAGEDRGVVERGFHLQPMALVCDIQVGVCACACVGQRLGTTGDR